MYTNIKIRQERGGYDDPGWYDHPPQTVAGPALLEEIGRDGSEL